MEEELGRAAIEMQVWSELEARKLRMEEQLLIENLIRKANEAVERIGQENGYDLVLFKNQTVNMQQGQQQAQLNIRIVAWSSEAIDLTDQIIQRMNNEYSAGQR